MKPLIRTTHRSRGFTLVELLISAVVIGLSLAFFANIVLRYLNEEQERAVASSSRIVATAAKRWLTDNYAAAQAGATATTPFVLDVPTLVSSGYLPTGWTSTNSFGQTLCVLVLEPTANRLQAVLVSEGGLEIPEGRLRAIARHGGAEGGFIDPNTPTPITGRGGYGGFVLNMTNYLNGSCSGTPAAAGRLMNAMFFGNDQVAAPYLYRNQVPGMPEVNRMNTAIDMGNNNLNNANQVNATTVNATQDVQGRRFLDRDDNTFQVDPNGTSVLRDCFVTNRSTTVRCSSLMGYFVETQISGVVNDSSLVAKASCPDAGFPYIYLVPKNIRIGPDYIANYDAADAGFNFQVFIRDGSNNPIVGASAFAKLGCYYA